MKLAKLETYEGVTTWTVLSNGEAVGEVQKERPWCNGVYRFQVRDNSKPWRYTSDLVDGEFASLAQVKAAIASALK